jgi:hypothetical protein
MKNFCINLFYIVLMIKNIDKKEISFYRKKYVDYTDKTPNEKRFNKNGVLDEIEFYPLGNIYINKYNKELIKMPLVMNEKLIVEKQWFLDKLQDEQIEWAIRFLQVKALKKYIIRNYSSTLFRNPFYQLFYTFYPVDKNLEATEQIINILINNYKNYEELITEIQLPKRKKKYILELLYSYLPTDEDNFNI